MKRLRLILMFGITVALLIAGIYAGIFWLEHTKSSKAGIAGEQLSAEQKPAAEQAQTPDSNKQVQNENPLLSGLETTSVESTSVKALETVFRLFLAVILAAILAFRPRKNVPLLRRNLYVAQT